MNIMVPTLRKAMYLSGSMSDEEYKTLVRLLGVISERDPDALNIANATIIVRR
jgi:hypothetical protein